MFLPEEIENERRIRQEAFRHFRQEFYEWAAILIISLILVSLALSGKRKEEKGAASENPDFVRTRRLEPAKCLKGNEDPDNDASVNRQRGRWY